MIEIERKFLVSSSTYHNFVIQKLKICQGYLNSNPERSVRIRIKEELGFITVKGKSNNSGLSRFEWEKEIPKEEALALLKLCENSLIEKNRFLVKSKGHVFEVDEFLGENEGLIIAELELHSEEESFSKPDWLGSEVTNDERYYNSYLSKNPFKKWKNR